MLGGGCVSGQHKQLWCSKGRVLLPVLLSLASLALRCAGTEPAPSEAPDASADDAQNEMLVCLSRAGTFLEGGELAEPKPLPKMAELMTIIAGIVAVMGYLGVMVYYSAWNRYAEAREKRFQATRAVDEVLNTLYTRFLPTVAIDGYEFKGITEKKEKIEIEFKDLGMKLKSNDRTILNGCSGTFPAGSMVAIMGPSGSGKTSFMNTLCGKAYYGKMTGTIKINGKEDDVLNYKNVTGFVPQDDVVFPKLTVREQILYSAKLRNSSETDKIICKGSGSVTSEPLLEAIVDDVLHVLQIGHIQRSVVGGVEEKGISGGQKKRVNIGLELAATPTLLFLDEPTSGLDSTSSLLIVRSLKRMAKMGMTIIMVIHQPRYSLFAEFDQVLLLAAGGRAVYQGSAVGATKYFQHLGFTLPEMENPADWIMDVIAGQVKNEDTSFDTQKLSELWNKNGGALQNGGTEEKSDGKGTESTKSEDVPPFDLKALASLVNEQWDSLDKNGDGTMDQQELTELLQEGTDSIPDFAGMKNLVVEIGGSDHRIDRSEFVHYISKKAKLPAAETNDPQSAQDLDEPFLGVTRLDAGLERKLPGFGRQLKVFLGRETVEFYRNLRERVITGGLLMFCGLVIGLLQRGKTDEPASIVIFHLGLALMIAVSVLPTFADKPIFWRESSHGINIGAFFLSKVLIRTISLAVLTVVYVTTYFLVTQPPVEWVIYMWPGLLVAWVASAWGYILSVYLPRSNATVAAVVLMLLLCGVLGQPQFVKASIEQGGFRACVVFFSIVRWTGQLFFIYYLDRTGGVKFPKTPECYDTMDQSEIEHRTNRWMKEHGEATFFAQLTEVYKETFLSSLFKYDTSAGLVMVFQGFVLCTIAALALKYTNREKQV